MKITTAIISSAAYEISKITKGTLLTHEFLANILVTTAKTNQYYERVSSLSNILRDNYLMHLDCKVGEGYLIVEANKTLQFLQGCIEKSENRLLRHYSYTRMVNIDEMSESVRNDTIAYRQKITTKEMMIRAGLRNKALTE